MKSIVTVALLSLVLTLPTTTRADVISTAVNYGAEGITVPTIGSSSSTGVSVGPWEIRATSYYSRPIIAFDQSDFAPLVGQTLTQATFNIPITLETFEPTDPGFTSEVRLFATSISSLSLTSSNHDAFAALTGDGGPHTVAGVATFVDGSAGTTVSVDFNTAGLTALESAINGSDTFIAIALREFDAFGDTYESIQFGDPTTSIRPTLFASSGSPIPEPASLGLLAMGSLLLVRRPRSVTRKATAQSMRG